jgi:hypothetical protein
VAILHTATPVAVSHGGLRGSTPCFPDLFQNQFFPQKIDSDRPHLYARINHQIDAYSGRFLDKNGNGIHNGGIALL